MLDRIMKKVANKPLDPLTATEWAKQAQLALIDALMSQSSWTTQQVAFHGGTSLHLSWSSPRHSEDLDFLLSQEVKDLDKVMPRVEKRVQESMMMIDPLMKVEVRDKTRDPDRMPCFHVAISKDGILGKALVKVEFWRVNENYLRSYPSEFRQPSAPGKVVSHLSHPVPAADLPTAFCDKLTAFATRPHLKWRDIYDLWWIGTQTDTPLDMATVAQQFLHNLSAYKTAEGLEPAAALRRFLARPIDEVVAAADPDLKRWLPDSLWQRLHPEGVKQMVDYTRFALDAVAAQLEGQLASGATLKRLPRP